MQNNTGIELEPLVPSVPKVCPGVEVVHSAAVSRRHYAERRARRRHDRIVTLRRHLTALCQRLQNGLPVTADCVLCAEKLALSLETDVAA
jgi:hypothetical protein